MNQIELQIRPGDCDSFGHINNAVYAAHFRHALAHHLTHLGFRDDWVGAGDFHWLAREMSLDYRLATGYGARLEANIWLEKADPLSPLFGYEVRKQDPSSSAGAPDQTLVRALGVWQRIDSRSGMAAPLSGELLAGLPQQGGRLPRGFKLPADSPEYRRYHWDHKVRRTELDPHGLVHPQAIYNWIEESVFEASSEAGWPMDRWVKQDLMVFQMRHDTTFNALPAAGDHIRIINRLANVRRRRGTWINEIFRRSDNFLLVRNFSTGVFLNLAGKSVAAPESMMNEIQFGHSGKAMVDEGIE